jgi:glycosyltransferase involved in cell wall biosynthesis
MKKKNILFVGAFNNNTKDKSTGGQLFACMSLIESDLKNKFNFITIDTTSDTVPAPPVYKRIPKVISRLNKFIFAITFKKIDKILIFSSAKLSFVEKGLMTIIGKILLKKVIFAPRSGLSLIDYEKSKFMRFFMPLVIKSSSNVLCQAENWKAFYQKISGVKDEKFIVINNWIDIDAYIHLKEKNQRNSILNIIYIGWFEEYKGIKDLLIALKIVAEKNIEFTCDLYGHGSKYSFAENFLLENNLKDKVFLKGWADKKNKMEALSNADLYILPSHNEGFPNALLEAMASKLPVISTKIGSINEIIEDGVNGLLVEKNNPYELAISIEELLINEALRLKISINARKTVLEKYTLKTAIEKFEKIL